MKERELELGRGTGPEIILYHRIVIDDATTPSQEEEAGGLPA